MIDLLLSRTQIEDDVNDICDRFNMLKTSVYNMEIEEIEKFAIYHIELIRIIRYVDYLNDFYTDHPDAKIEEATEKYKNFIQQTQLDDLIMGLQKDIEETEEQKFE